MVLRRESGTHRIGAEKDMEIETSAEALSPVRAKKTEVDDRPDKWDRVGV